MKKNMIIAGVSAVAIAALVAGGVVAYNAHMEQVAAQEIFDFNQQVEQVYAAQEQYLNDLVLENGTHEEMLQNLQDLVDFRNAIQKDALLYHDGSANLYEQLVADCDAAIDADAEWLRADWNAQLDAVVTDGDDKEALRAAADSAAAIAAGVESENLNAEIWGTAGDMTAFTEACQSKVDAANARIAEIEQKEAEEKAAKEEAERKAAEEQAAREAEAAAAASSSNYDNGGSSKSSSSNGGSKSSGSKASSSSSKSTGSSSSSSNSSVDDRQTRELPKISEEDWYSIPEDEEI